MYLRFQIPVCRIVEMSVFIFFLGVCFCFRWLLHFITNIITLFWTLPQKSHAFFSVGSFFFFSFLGWHLQNMEVPRLGVKFELQLPAYATATATQDPSRICHQHHSSQQRRILSEARDWTHILMDISWVCYFWATLGTPRSSALMK